MAINKLMDKLGNVLFDLSADTATTSDVKYGVTFHDRTGALKMGIWDGKSGGGSSVDPTYLKTGVVFYDFDGTVLYKYTQEEFEALTALPSLPDRTSENLTCEGWNCTLDEIKETYSDVGSCQIGAVYHTTDGSDYFHIRLTSNNKSVSLNISTTSITIDWGDGTVTTSGKSHTYASMGDYEIKLTSSSSYKISGYVLGSQSENYNLVGDVRLSSNITELGSYAFYYCYSLSSVTIPSSVTSIGSQAFYYCYSLSSVTIPSSVTSIASQAFSSCYSLTSVTIPSSVTSIGSQAFSSCSSLSSVTIPSSVTSIASQAFSYCYSLSSVTIPSSVTSIVSYAFYYCSSLSSVTIPSSVTSIGSQAFYYCSSLSSVTIPSSVTSIASQAFSSCYSLTSVTIPSSVTSIDSNAFCYCSSLSFVDLSSHENPPTLPSLTSIGFDSNYTRTIYYVASSSLSAFSTATNWSTIYAKGLIRVKEGA